MLRYRALIGRRCTLVLPDGRTITGKVLRGIYGSPEWSPRFRIRSRETWYVRLPDAARLREATKRRGAP